MPDVGMRVHVDLDLCDSHGECAIAAPQVFEITDDDLLVVHDDTPPEELRPAVVAAAQRCPKLAITLAEE